MARFIKYFGFLLLAILLIAVALFATYYFSRTSSINSAMEMAGPPADTLIVEGIEFRDLNKNGTLDPYEDHRMPVDQRVEDLLAQMTLEEKAGMMFHNFVVTGENGQLAGPLNPMNLNPVEVALFQQKMNFFNLFNVPEAQTLAEWTNRVQKLAERTRLGIPVTFSSDPRHTSMQTGAAIGFYTEGFSHWTEPIGFGSIKDTALVQRFGEIAAQEYRSVGIHTGLHPMLDVATDPRWGRISGTFGEDAELTAQLGAAYIRGFQGDSLTERSVSTMSKHFPGGGPQQDGLDPHFYEGKNQVYPSGRFDYHLQPFIDAIEAGTSQMMPYYGVPIDAGYEEVAFGFNEGVLTNLLKDSLNYEGIVCSDWGIISDAKILGYEITASKDFGVEDLTQPEKVRDAILAGIDQFGGESVPEYVIDLVENGRLEETRIDQSVRKLLKLKFELGLFNNPYVDVDAVPNRAGTPEFTELGYQSQLRSQVLLTNKEHENSPILPLEDGTRIYVHNMSYEAAENFAEVVEQPEEADVIILNLDPPHEPGAAVIAGIEIFRQGRLYYTDEELQPLLDLIETKPTVVTMYLERPFVIPEIIDRSSAALAHFGSSEEAIFDVLFGEFNPEGTLPFQMPSTWNSVLNQAEDQPFDLDDPLFDYGHGLSYN